MQVAWRTRLTPHRNAWDWWAGTIKPPASLLTGLLKPVSYSFPHPPPVDVNVKVIGGVNANEREAHATPLKKILQSLCLFN
jgi:hypothetical protein